MAPRFSAPDPRIDAVRGCVAIERGPEVLALESVDLAGSGSTPPMSRGCASTGRFRPGSGTGGCSSRCADAQPVEREWPYGDVPHPDAPHAAEVPLVAYHDWARRGPSTMRVWIPEVG